MQIIHQFPKKTIEQFDIPAVIAIKGIHNPNCTENIPFENINSEDTLNCLEKNHFVFFLSPKLMITWVISGQHATIWHEQLAFFLIIFVF